MTVGPSDLTGSSSVDRNPVGLLAEEFAERLRRGERPSITEYIERHPEHAEEIRDLFPALAALEQFKSENPAPKGPAEPAGGRLERLGDYVILREVGRGGMGVVYEAEQESLGRHVALKVLPGTALLSPQTLERFRREARSAAKLHHTNIVPVFGIGEHEGLHYYVMQFIHGRGLDEVIKELQQLKTPGLPPSTGVVDADIRRQVASRGPEDASAADIARALTTGLFIKALEGTIEPGIGPTATIRRRTASGASSTSMGGPRTETAPSAGEAQSGGSIGARLHTGRSGLSELTTSSITSRPYWQGIARIGVQVARALEHAHSQGIFHRDIKPSNLLLDVHGAVWVADFGLAKATADTDLTHTGDVVGTLRYMAPERFSGQSDARSDLYSLGLTLYELLTLRPAFGATDRNRLIRQVSEAEPERPRKLVPEVPRDLETICLKCIEREPFRRYASAQALADDLERWLENRPIAARPVSSLERAVKWAGRNRALAGLLATATTSMVGGLILVSWYNVRLSGALAEARLQQERAELGAYTANINLVRRSIEVGDASSALTSLDRLGPERGGMRDRRGFEWHYLRRLCDYEVLDRFETGVPVECLAFSPDGERIATGHGYSDHRRFEDRPGRLQVRHAETGRVLLDQTAHRGPVFDVTFSPDGRTIATAGADRTAKLWDAATGALRHTLSGHRFSVNGVSFSPEGKRVVTAAGDRYTQYGGYKLEEIPPGDLAVWDVATGERIWLRDDPPGSFLSARFSPDGSRLAAGGAPEFLMFLEPATGRELGRYRGRAAMPTDFSADGRWLITVSHGHSTVWDTTSGFRPQIHNVGAVRTGNRLRLSFIRDAIFQPPHAEIIVMTRGLLLPEAPEDVVRLPRLRWIFVTDFRSNLLYRLDGHRAPVRGLAFRKDGRRLASGDAGGEVVLWEPFQAKPPAIERELPCRLRAVAFHRDGRRFACAGDDGIVRLDGMGPGVASREWAGHTLAVHALAFSPDGRDLASVGEDGTVRIRPTEGEGQDTSVVLAGHKGPVFTLAYRPDGRRLASAGADGSVRLWNRAADGGQPRAGAVLPGHSGTVLSVGYAPDGRRLASAGGDGIVRIWDDRSGQLERSWAAHGGTISALVFLGPEGRYLASAGADRFIRLWDVRDGRLVREIGGHTQEVLGLTCGGIGRARLVSIGRDRTVRLWDPETGQEVLSLQPRTSDDLTAAAFSPDGLTLATVGFDHTLRLWQAAPSPHALPPGQDWDSRINGNPGR